MQIHWILLTGTSIEKKLLTLHSFEKSFGFNPTFRRLITLPINNSITTQRCYILKTLEGHINALFVWQFFLLVHFFVSFFFKFNSYMYIKKYAKSKRYLSDNNETLKLIRNQGSDNPDLQNGDRIGRMKCFTISQIDMIISE